MSFQWTASLQLVIYVQFISGQYINTIGVPDICAAQAIVHGVG